MARRGYGSTRRTLTREYLANFMPSQGLFRGVPVYLVSPENHFAPWMTDSDILMSMTLFGNVVASHAIASFGRMSDILGQPRDRRLDSIGTVVSESIDRKFWLPDRGYYSGYLYGSAVVPIQSQITDNMGQAMALYPGGGMSPVKEAIVTRTPRFETGMSLSYPLIDGSDLPGRQIFFNTMQSMWTIASLQSHDQNASIQTLAAMCLKTAQTGNDSHDALRAVVMRGVLGMAAVDTGITFNPFVPDAIGGVTEIRNLKIRDAVYDIRVAGNGIQDKKNRT